MMKLYFRDNFFSTGITEIKNEAGEQVGYLDLKSAFRSSMEVYNMEQTLICVGKFRRFSSKWEVSQADPQLGGVLRPRFAFFNKKFTYITYGRGRYAITSPAFSRTYEVHDEQGRLTAAFQQVNGWFSSGAFELHNHSAVLNSYELVAVIMGMHAIHKRNSAAVSAAVT